jgi:hypothetical protein
MRKRSLDNAPAVTSRWLLRTLATLFAVVVAGTAAAPPSGAQSSGVDPTQRDQPTVVVGEAGVPTDVVAAARAFAAGTPAANTTLFTRNATTSALADLPPIQCVGRSQYPHRASTVPGSIDNKADSWCTAPVLQVHAQAEMYEYVEGLGFFFVGSSPLRFCHDCAGPMTAVNLVPCPWSGTRYYVGRGRHWFLPPPGYNGGAPVEFFTGTPVVSVSC